MVNHSPTSILTTNNNNNYMTTVYFLHEQVFTKGELISRGKTKTKIKQVSDFHPSLTREFYVKNENLCEGDDMVCIVWEAWKGKNGKGSYRIDKEKFPLMHTKAKQIPLLNGPFTASKPEDFALGYVVEWESDETREKMLRKVEPKVEVTPEEGENDDN